MIPLDDCSDATITHVSTLSWVNRRMGRLVREAKREGRRLCRSELEAFIRLENMRSSAADGVIGEAIRSTLSAMAALGSQVEESLGNTDQVVRVMAGVVKELRERMERFEHAAKHFDAIIAADAHAAGGERMDPRARDAIVRGSLRLVE